MSYADAKQVSSDVIPVIDITSLRDGTDAETVARQLHAANTGLGFIYIKGHGIPNELITKTRAAAFEFFRTSPKNKEVVRVSKSHRGWIDVGGAKMEDDAKPDLKESFVWGYQDKTGNMPDDHELRGQNQWPTFLPDMENIAMEYFEAAHSVAHCLMQGFALGLGLDRNFFLQTNDAPLSRASMVYYPAQPETAGKDQFGVGAHTDFGVLTVLCQDDVGGLQVQDINGDWIAAPPIESTLIVNVADLLSRWTNGAYKSTPHRVVNSSGKERLSLVLAYDPNPETIIDARDVFGPECKPENPPITCGDYLNWRFAKAFSHKKA